MANSTDQLGEMVKRLGYARNNQVKLYGETFNLLSDPISAGENLIVVDGQETRSGQVKRVRIPLTVVNMAKQQRKAA